MSSRTKEGFVADFLREGILSGQFPRGQRLKQAEIAAQLDISITPVREALRLLAAEGYVLGITHRGALVAPFEAAAAAEVIELRAQLESQITLAAMRRITLGEMEKLRSFADDFESAAKRADVNGTRAANYRLHRFVYTLADQPQTAHFLQILWAKYPFDLIGRIDGRIIRAAREHTEILDAMLARDADAAREATRRHVYAGWEELQRQLAARPADAGDAHGAQPQQDKSADGDAMQ
jgi:DNA-binding GntR family transcriptional regulator